jgi:hypothetical protein
VGKVYSLTCTEHLTYSLCKFGRGNFTINDGNFDVMKGLVAYTSNQASPKVRETASLLPGSVSIEMLPRHEVFPKKFGTSDVTAEDIGLYFFPEKERFHF